MSTQAQAIEAYHLTREQKFLQGIEAQAEEIAKKARKRLAEIEVLLRPYRLDETG